MESSSRRSPVSTSLSGRRAVLLLIPGLLLATSSTSWAHWTKLSSGASYSDVLTDYVVSPDGEWVVYWHDRDGEDVYELFSAPTSGAGPDRRISGLLPAGAVVPREMAITPDSSTVVYVAEQETTDVRELFAVPIAGGAITKLNHNLAADHGVKDFKISPLGDRVIYALWTTSSSYDDIYTVPITGGTAEKLNGAVTQVITYDVSPLGDYVVHHGWTGGSTEELYSGPIDASAPATKLNGALVTNGDVWSFQISPLGDRVVYRGDVQVNDKVEIYSVPIAGDTSVKLNHTHMLSTGEIKSFEINQQGTHVAYLVDEVDNFYRDLWVAPIATSGGANRMNQRRGSGDTVINSYKFSPLGDRVAFLYYEWDTGGGPDHIELYTNAIAGGSRVKLNTDLDPQGDIDDFQFTPDGQWVLYTGDPDDSLWVILYRAPAAGPAADEIVALNEIPFGQWYMDTERDRVVLAGNDPFLDNIVRPWTMPLSSPNPFGGDELVDDSEFDADGDVTRLTPLPNGRVVYVADQEFDNEFELYVVLTNDLFSDGFESGDALAWTSP